MNFGDYEREYQARYLALAKAVRRILIAALDEQDHLHVHNITRRAKEPASLLKKLRDRNIDPNESLEEKIKDFAGCRVVFLTNSEMEGFHQTGILRDHFTIIDANVHHPVPGTGTEDKLFDSNNFLVELRPELLAQPEYASFAGLRCEIQVQTLLKHAWAEMGHDTIYKKPKLKGGLGQRAFERIEERMNKVMRDYLVPAGHDFDKIARDFNRLVQANDAADGTREKMQTAADNNVRDEALETLDDLVIPMYDNLPEQFAELIPDLVGAVEAARDVEISPIETPFGNLDGKTSLDIAKQVGRILTEHRYYCDQSLIFYAALRLYVGASSDEERAVWIGLGEKLAEHNLRVWESHGPALQGLILEQTAKLSDGQKKAGRGLLVAMLGSILSAEVSGTTSSFEGMTIHQGTVRPSEALDHIRGDAIRFLEQFLDEAADDAERKLTLDALRKAGQHPHLGRHGPEVSILVMRDGAQAARLFSKHIDKYGLALKHWCETTALHWHYACRALRPDLANNAEAIEAQSGVVRALIELRNRLNADPEFVLFKTLVGHDSVRPAAWDGDAFDYEDTEAWRRAQFPALIAGISVDSVDEWFRRLQVYLAASDGDGAQYWILQEFLRELTEVKSEVGLALADRIDDERAFFLPSILKGLHTAGQCAAIDQRSATWVGEGRFLFGLAIFYSDVLTYNIDRVTGVIEKAIERGEEGTVMRCMDIAIRLYNEKPDGLIERVFMPGVEFFQGRKNPHWANAWLPTQKSGLLNELDAADAQAVLSSFERLDRIDYRADSILTAIGERHPGLVIDFFGRRMQRDRADRGRFFEAVPYSLHNLPGVLANHADLLLDAARRWYAQEPLFHEFRGARLISQVFPGLPDNLLQAFTAIVRDGGEDNWKFIVSSLRPYEGDERMYPLCMDIVERLEPESELLHSISLVLQVTGVMRGEFGYVEAYAAQKSKMEPWLKDPRDKVRVFAAEQVRDLEQSMAWEQRRAERDYEARRREWD